MITVHSPLLLALRPATHYLQHIILVTPSYRMQGCISKGLRTKTLPRSSRNLRVTRLYAAEATPISGTSIIHQEAPKAEHTQQTGTRTVVNPGTLPTNLFASDLYQEGPRNVPGALPSELDAQRFSLDPSVAEWCNYSQKRGELPDILRLIASQASKDAQSSAYWAYHMARFGFFLTQVTAALVAHTVSEQLAPVSSQTAAQDFSRLPAARIAKNLEPEHTNRLWEAYGTWKQDLAWISSGVYKLPWDMITPNKQFNPLVMAAQTARFALEASAVLQDYTRGETDRVWLQSKFYPQYYQTFHHQSDGWLSSWSASNYEHSTETLFMGRQDAMQRSALVPISKYLASSATPASGMRLLEVAAGTGRFHTFIKDNWPDMPSICSDLSPFYLEHARENMKQWKQLRQLNRRLGGVDDTGVKFMQMAAEKLNLPDESCDIVVCMYLFHELPSSIRRKAVAEWFRVLKPGGLCVFTDSTQLGDRPEFGSSIGQFGSFNEPYFENYVACDLGGLLKDAGFQPGTKYTTSVTKTLSAYKPR